MRTRILAIASAAVLLLSGCTDKKTYEYPFQDPSLKVDERVENLISLLTPEEKVGLMMNKSVSVDRLGIPSFNWWSEACHGLRAVGYTVYPQYIGLSASFNPEMVYDVFESISDEARANWNRSEREYNVGLGTFFFYGNPELAFWCPNVNIFRDPRWGRGQETPGEDPYLSSVMGTQTVRAMQGDDDRYYKTVACAKHFAVHSGPEESRHRFDVSVSKRDLWETYLPAFKTLVTEAGVQQVMCAYHRYEGVPCCMNDRLLEDILRNQWGYKSLVVTDCSAISNFYNKGQHETHPDAASASADAILHGTDLECGTDFQSLLEALNKGLIKESDLDVHVSRVLKTRFELGMFDPAEMLPWADLGPEVISSEEHDAQAVSSAAESIVLLKNDGVLPLSKDIRKIAVLGPNAVNFEMQLGNYSGAPTPNHVRPLLSGIRKMLPNAEVIYEKACDHMDDYYTVDLISQFNDGKGLKGQFYNGNNFSNEVSVENYYTSSVNLSTFGAYRFAEGVDVDNVAVRMSGTYKADYTGKLSYYIYTDNGYKLKVNGRLIDDGSKAREAFGFANTADSYLSFDVKEGQTYDIEVEYQRGTSPFANLSIQLCRRYLADFEALAQRLSDVDAIVFIGGITPGYEGEGGDRPDIELPAVQRNLLKAMHKTGKPVVFVNCSGSAMGLEGVENDYDALLQAWYPGQGGAEALAAVLFGDFNPSGRLPVTFYKSTAQLPDFEDYRMEGRTYRYFEGEPMYPFGYGLSYSEFDFGQAKLSAAKAKVGKSVKITVPVKNVSSVDGSEVVQVYVKSLDLEGAPIKSLRAFEKVNIAAGQTANVTLTLGPDAFSYYDGNDGLAPHAGRYQILYGSSSADSDLQTLDFTLVE